VKVLVTEARPQLAALSVADPVDAWAALGFAVEADALTLGGVRITLGVAGTGIVSWSLSGLAGDPGQLDGLPTTAAPPPGSATAPAQPNGAIGVDHVVVLTPDFDRTAAAFAAAGMPLRRERTVGSGPDAFRQGFRRLGPAIAELVEGRRLPAATARFWGLTLIVSDIDALAARLGPELLSTPKDAVQPGRRIATLRTAAGLSTAVAFMNPE
jgi:hypothetical protein